MTKSLLGLFLLLLCFEIAGAQKPEPVNEQWVFFPFATGERSDKKLKVMVIGTHLIRYKNLNVGYTQLGDVAMQLDFRKILERIEQNERYFPADYNNIQFSKTSTEDLHGGYLAWNSSVVRENDLQSSDNTLSAMEKIRTKLIDSYKANGYKVYQVDFMPQTEGPNNSHYLYYDQASATYKPYTFERLSPLSPLYVKAYQPGDIRSMLAQFSERTVSGGSSGLVIESTDTKKSSNSSGTRGGSYSGGTRQRTDEEIRIDISYHKTLAEADAAEGDRLYKLGTMFYPAALQKYKSAQQNYYSPDVQRRIDEISGYMALGQALASGAEALDNLAANVDPHKKTRWLHAGLNYTGFGGSYSKIKNGAAQKPMEGLLTITGHRLFFAFEIRMGYYASPVYEYIVTGVGNSSTPYTVQTEQGAFGLGLSGGINIPLKALVLYAMYGFDAPMFTVSKKISPSQFTFNESEMSASFPATKTRTTFGFTFQIPKSRVGIGAQYILYSIKGEEDGAEPVIYSGNPSGKYYLDRTTDEKYQYGNFGVTLSLAL